MIALANMNVRLEQGFEVYALRSRELELEVVPELGARIISLKNRRTGREWLWHPDGGLKLFRNRLGDDFSKSTLAGVDECVPTVAPCSWNGRTLPDHGEVWSVPWRVDPAAWAEGVLKCTVDLSISPFQFQRTVSLHGGTVQMDYMLTNRSTVDEQYLWALHPLLRVHPGDRLILPTETRALLNGEPWLDALDSQMPNGGCSKFIAGPLPHGMAGVANNRTGDELIFEWSPAENNSLGLWLTRGGWHGHHHFALEPTNGAADPLTHAAAQQRCGLVRARSSARWSVRLKTKP